MKWALVLGCFALGVMGLPHSAEACRGLGRGGGRLGAQLVSAGMATTRMIAAQEQYAAAQRAEAHRKQVATFSSLREQELARREARRQARLSGQGRSESIPATASEP